jgi:N-acetyl-anhydromuramyl-L-alanine amidase AmpD
MMMAAEVRQSGTRAVLLAALIAAGCAPGGGSDQQDGDLREEVGVDALPPGETEVDGTPLDMQFAAAAERFDVPEALLKSIAWVETRWQMVDGAEEFDGRGARHGIMALHDADLDHAAELAELPVEDVLSDSAANIEAGAALLSSLAEDEPFDRADVGAWAEVTARYSRIEVEIARNAYVHEEVYATLARGVVTEGATLEPLDAQPYYPLMDQATSSGPDYEPAKWRPSPNNSSRPSGVAGDPQMVIIHTCEGAYSGCWGWLTNAASNVSAHYVVNSTGSEVSQLVRENRKAWHIGATYKCSRNDDVACNLNGVGSNGFTIGIEHAGSSSQASWSPGLLDASSALTCDITEDHGIPRDAWHIVGHGQLQPYNRTDPGPNWPWAAYIDMVNTACGGGSPPPPDEPPPDDPPTTPGDLVIVVDSNQSANGSNAQIVVSGNWRASSNVSGYFNTGYWWRSTGASSDAAEFRAHLPSAMTMVVEAWWPAAGDRSTAAPFVIFDSNGQQLDVVHKNQRQNGGQWVTIGTYAFTAGWNTVALSRWTAPGDVVVADAVRFREVN